MKKKETGLVISGEKDSHNTGEGHFEKAERVTEPLKALEEAKIPGVEVIKADPASKEDLELCHTSEYVDFLEKKSASVKGVELLYQDDSDMKISGGSEKTARAAVGAVLKACKLVSKGDLANAFCLIRPPGHHALKDRAMGFCFYNNVALGAKFVKKQFPKIKKILILDWDLHHGNGTQSFFENDKDVFYFSLQLQGVFPHDPAQKILENDSTLNVNVKSSLTGMDEIMMAFSKLEAKMEFFKPDLVMISCGFDGHAEEKIVGGGFGLSDEDYAVLAKRVKNLAEKYSDGKLVSVLEGGYNIEVLKRVILDHLQVLAD